MADGKGTEVSVKAARRGWVRLVVGRDGVALMADDADGLADDLRRAAAEARGGAVQSDAADLTRLRALLAAYGRAVEVEEEQWSNGTEAAYIEAAAAADTAMKAIQTEAAKWREWG